MYLPVVIEVLPFFFGSLVVFGLLGLIFRRFQWKRTAWACFVLGVIAACYMLYFFRDPQRTSPSEPALIVAGADGVVMSIKEIREDEYLKTDAVRISIFLSLFDVHVNRAPIEGKIAFLGYFPGARFFTFDEKSSEFNQHNSILIEGPQTRCLVNQIVGPVARRVVYWLKLDQMVQKGDRIGMMKFGSRLDMIFPKADVDVVIQPGDRVQAGLTVVATMKPKL
ncbi:MAG: phosphatidylserine decarboxylase family protein [Verrucomicrobia bacterium]|nr:phosphatidylserine decarboxylase family protein [Verrucomicrobiota bacterium]MBU4292200.1 phosphatidylserine decarboxylase family protein [Verrucomicrobiota bacterium]MBU4496413.1 phosphatidylserine decarboxylase family protein [Verrucomicrobiota bacterium]MCG2678714.1 phosphatidylserine decarboxylase [Kiritimatiellia bacterium]